MAAQLCAGAGRHLGCSVAVLSAHPADEAQSQIASPQNAGRVVGARAPLQRCAFPMSKVHSVSRGGGKRKALAGKAFGALAAASEKGKGTKGVEVSSELLTWMRENGLPSTCKVELREKPGASSDEDGLHYVVASEDLQPGDIALQVPGSLIVTLERVLGDETIAELVTTNKLSELACLALYLMYEKKRGSESFWHPYIQELDRQRGRGQSAVETPLLWSDEEVAEFFQGSPMKEVVQERMSGMKREYGELDAVWFLAGSLFKEYPFDIPSEAFPFQIFKQAFIAVQACIVHLQGVSIARRFALVPLGPPLLSYKSTSRAMLVAEGGGVVLRVDRPVKAGEAITVWCGPQPNTRLLLNYGFVDEDNPYDRLAIKASLAPTDPLYQSKRAIVQRNDKLTIQTYQLYRGKEKDVINEMLPYLRLGHVTDPDEMASVTFAEGPVCPVSACNEMLVLDQLSSYFRARLAGYPTTRDEDDKIISDPSTDPRRQVAARLVRIEKEILQNALGAVEEIVASLPESAKGMEPCGSPHPPVLS